MACANNSLLLTTSELISGTIQTICETACEHKKAFDGCIENASVEYECMDNDMVVTELAKLRQLVRLWKNDRNCDVNSEAFKQHYADESQRILHIYDRGREDLYETYEDDDFVEEHNTNSLFKTKYFSRALFISDIKRQEPVDNVYIPESNKITFFTEIINYANHHVSHHWKYKNETKFELSFNVRRPRWRGVNR